MARDGAWVPPDRPCADRTLHFVAKTRIMMPLPALARTAALLVPFALGACADNEATPEPPPALIAGFGDIGSDEPGCAVGVMEDGALRMAAGFGLANLDHGIPNRPTTVFRIGSASKQITAGAVALLALDGALDLDRPARDYVPELPAYDPAPTVRQLVHHTSGIRDYLTLMSLAGYRDDDWYTNDEVLAMLSRQDELNFAAGSDWLYSNAGYFLLGEIVRRVSGRTLRQFAEERFFGPLGMDHTHYQDDHAEVVPLRAVGYAPTDDAFRVSVTTLDMVGDGGVFTSVEDWVHWDANLTSGAVGGDAWVRLMHESGVLTSGESTDYAFGLGHGEHRGQRVVSHGGAFVGYRAAMRRYPDLGVSFVAFCNRADGRPGERLVDVAEAVLADRLGDAEETVDDDVGGAGQDAEADGDPVADPAPYLGDYHSRELDATYRIAAGDGGLTLTVGRLEPMTLLEGEPGTLVARGQPLTLRFQAGGAGYGGFRLDAGRVRNLGFVRAP